MDAKEFIVDLAKRAAHTFWQSFSASVVVLWAGSGLNVDSVTNIDAWQKLGLSLAAAALASAFSTLKSLTAGAVTSTPAAASSTASGLTLADIPVLPSVATVQPSPDMLAAADPTQGA